MLDNRVLTAVDIIIVNWNAGNLLLNCIKSIQKSINGFVYTIYIIDNCSTDDSLAQIENMSEKVQIIRLSGNLGFSKACNFGAKKGNSPYLLFLNPDTEVFPDSIIKSLQFLMNNPDIGILGVKHVDENGKTRKSCSRFLTFQNSIFSILGFSKFFPSLFKPATLMSEWDHEVSKKVDQVMGAYMLLRRSDFEQLNGFDERFFVYYEDMDLAKRILNIKKTSFYNSEISIYHKGEGTTDSIPSTRLVYVTKSKLEYAKKHWPKANYTLLIIFTFILEPWTRSVFLLIQGKMSYIPGTFKAFFTLFNNLFKSKN